MREIERRVRRIVHGFMPLGEVFSFRGDEPSECARSGIVEIKVIDEG